MKKSTRLSLIAPLLAASGVVAAETQDAPQVPAAYCQDNERFNEWDFWVGEWKVYTNNADRVHVGNNSITKHYENCLIKETWVSLGGNGGFSINFFNPVRGQWRQVWVANGYSIDYTGGLNEQGQMVLEGEIDNYQPNISQRFRGIWTPEENGDVIQRFETYDAESDSWSVWFEGRYVKQ